MTRRRRQIRDQRRANRRVQPGRVGVISLMVLGLVGVGVFFAAAGEDQESAAQEPAGWTGGLLRVDVRNGGGVSGMAGSATRRLRADGFDVVHWGNATAAERGQPSVVIDHVGRPDMAQAVAKALGISNVLSDPDPNLYVDVSVVLGGEWDPDVPSEDDAPTGSRPWWHPRSWLGS
jgi:hypothetical protein